MMDNLNVEDTNKLDDEKIQIIMRQTDYTFETSREKLIENDYDHLKVIRNYFGIVDKKPTAVKSTNQEIYRQIRSKLDVSMREYNERKEKEEK